METSLSFWVVFAVSVMIMGVLCDPLKIEHSSGVTYAELEASGTSCHPSDSCTRGPFDFFNTAFSCDCDPSCTVYDTCCLDSEFRTQTNSLKNERQLKCLNIYNNPDFHIFMVDSCKNDEANDNLCYSNPEENNDPFLVVPVTSEVSGITYKNYFCAVCNEEVDSEQLRFWDIQISVNGTMLTNISEPHFKFNKTIQSWTVNDGKGNETSDDIAVALNIHRYYGAPYKFCEANVISNCTSNWTDEVVSFKCSNYMAIVIGSQNKKFRNPHCALCNFENLINLKCLTLDMTTITIGAALPPGVNIPLLSLFVLEDRPKRCGRNMVYDKFADKCRCNSRIFKKEDGKCVYKILRIP